MSRVAWTDVPLYWLDSARALTDDERTQALAEYRRTGGMYLIVMAEPTGSDSPEECERLSNSGPTVEQIDWTGFAVEVSSWEEQVRAAYVAAYGPGAQRDLETVDLDDYRGVSAEQAALDIREQIAGRAAYLAHFSDKTAAVRFEEQALSIGSEFLPSCALAVRDGGEPSDEYWAWLCAQLADSEVVS